MSKIVKSCLLAAMASMFLNVSGAWAAAKPHACAPAETEAVKATRAVRAAGHKVKKKVKTEKVKKVSHRKNRKTPRA